MRLVNLDSITLYSALFLEEPVFSARRGGNRHFRKETKKRKNSKGHQDLNLPPSSRIVPGSRPFKAQVKAQGGADAVPPSPDVNGTPPKVKSGPFRPQFTQVRLQEGMCLRTIKRIEALGPMAFLETFMGEGAAVLGKGREGVVCAAKKAALLPLNAGGTTTAAKDGVLSDAGDVVVRQSGEGAPLPITSERVNPDDPLANWQGLVVKFPREHFQPDKPLLATWEAIKAQLGEKPITRYDRLPVLLPDVPEPFLKITLRRPKEDAMLPGTPRPKPFTITVGPRVRAQSPRVYEEVDTVFREEFGEDANWDKHTVADLTKSSQLRLIDRYRRYFNQLARVRPKQLAHLFEVIAKYGDTPMQFDPSPDNIMWRLKGADTPREAVHGKIIDLYARRSDERDSVVRTYRGFFGLKHFTGLAELLSNERLMKPTLDLRAMHLGGATERDRRAREFKALSRARYEIRNALLCVFANTMLALRIPKSHKLPVMTTSDSDYKTLAKLHRITTILGIHDADAVMDLLTTPPLKV
jgi:hypothetical protein